MSKRTKKKREVRELVKGKFIRMASSYKKYKNPYIPTYTNHQFDTRE
jgi:hypothetical protein